MAKVIKTTPKKAYEKLSKNMNNNQKEEFKEMIKGSKEVHIFLNKVKDKIENKDFSPIERLDNGVTLICRFEKYKGQFVDFEGEKYYIAKDRTDLKQQFGYLFDKRIKKKIEPNHIITSFVTNMCYMFSSATEFNEDISNWDTSKVEDMIGMFQGAEAFNQSIGSWDVSNVTNMNSMFLYCYEFNQPLNNWNTSKVEDMLEMFKLAKSFNQPLNNWNTSNVKDMDLMFTGAESFNQDISNWNVGKVKDHTDFDKNTSKNWKDKFKPKFK